MHMLTDLQNEASQEIRDHEAMVHDQVVKSEEKAKSMEDELQWLKIEQEVVFNEKTKAFDDR